MSRRRHRKGQHGQQRETQAQLVALIPAGPVNAQQARRVEVEQVAVGDNKNVLVTREVVSTPVRKLFGLGYITASEVGAAVRFREDYETAFLTSRNPLEAVQVDSKGRTGEIHGAMLYRASAAIRFHDAEAALGPRILAIVRALVLGDDEAGVGRSFTAVGADMAPSASRQEQMALGRGAGIIALQHLAWTYERVMRVIFGRQAFGKALARG